MPTKKEPLSAALQLLELVWGEMPWKKNSYRTINTSMHMTLDLALTSGLAFGLDDFAYMSKHFRLGYWCGELEMFYAAAVERKHMSAIKAYEHYRDRKPYIFPITVNRKTVLVRLASGTKFRWRDHNVTVTSFKDDGPYLIACSYTWTEGDTCPTCHVCRGSSTKKVQHMFQIDHQDLKDERNRLKRLAATPIQLQEIAA
jgi:hypothetical protein